MTWEINWQGWVFADHWSIKRRPWGVIYYLGPVAIYGRKVIRL